MLYKDENKGKGRILYGCEREHYTGDAFQVSRVGSPEEEAAEKGWPVNDNIFYYMCNHRCDDRSRNTDT